MFDEMGNDWFFSKTKKQFKYKWYAIKHIRIHTPCVASE